MDKKIPLGMPEMLAYLLQQGEPYHTEDIYGKEFQGPYKIGNNVRLDGSLKDIGYFGGLKTPEGRTATELSVDTNMDGKTIFGPSIVPTLNRSELDTVINQDPYTATIWKKIWDYAKKRITEGKSPFASKGEQVPVPEYPGPTKFWSGI